MVVSSNKLRLQISSLTKTPLRKEVTELNDTLDSTVVRANKLWPKLSVIIPSLTKVDKVDADVPNKKLPIFLQSPQTNHLVQVSPLVPEFIPQIPTPDPSQIVDIARIALSVVVRLASLVNNQ